MKNVFRVLIFIMIVNILQINAFAYNGVKIEKKDFVYISTYDKDGQEENSLVRDKMELQENKYYLLKLKDISLKKGDRIKAKFEKISDMITLVKFYIYPKEEKSILYDDIIIYSKESFNLFTVGTVRREMENKNFIYFGDEIFEENGFTIPENIKSDFEILTRPVFSKNIVSVHSYVRIEGEKEWKDGTKANVSDVVEYAIEFKNLQVDRLDNVMIKALLPKNMEYIENSVKLFNTNHKNGLPLQTDKTDKIPEISTIGYNIGDYAKKSNAIIVFKARVVDKTLVKGLNQVRMWGQVGIANDTFQDYADVFISK
ncbi:hypothetical protein [Peptoanaerobacter stomatis]|uniref:hypothetical protein n=1 Tax=Peptoanaerobacter stomatis TaxID=796937 RepID=UPI003FA16D91